MLLLGLAFTLEVSAAVFSLIYIHKNIDKTNYEYVKKQRVGWFFIFIFLGSIPWTFSTLIHIPTHLIVGSSILISAVGILFSTWNRENMIKNVEHGDRHVETYQFVLPTGAYADMNLEEWMDLVVNKDRYIVEVHLRPREDGKEHKFCFTVEDKEPLNDIQEDQHMFHGCRLCETAEREFVSIKYCWNNPLDHKVNNSDLCRACYIGLLDELGTNIVEVEYQKASIIANNL
jgi:hypothetical protein